VARQKREVFPAGLYGMLLFALCCLTLPGIAAPIERLLVGTACLVPWALGGFGGEPAAAADAGVAERVAALARQLDERLREHDLGQGPAVLLRDHEPMLCGVVASERRGGGGQPCELRLDRSHAELAGCAEFVTKGDVLLGTLVRQGQGVAAADAATDHARVLLLNHPAARAVAAVAQLPEGGALRMVVRGAAAVDPAPLRVDLWDDPYRAARLDRGGFDVRTLALPPQYGGVPGGLWLGRTLVWGFDGDGIDAPVTIGVFVVPPIEPRALSHVVVWRKRDGVAPPGRRPEPLRRAATVRELPGASAGRWLVAADVAVPDGAAVVLEGFCLGTARGLSFGLGLLTAFPSSRHPWNLLLLPDDPALRPREIVAQVERSDAGAALVRWRGDSLDGESQRLPPGYLFTGSNGPHCPPGLLLGTAVPHRFDRSLLEVTTPSVPGPQAAQVVAAEEER